MAPPIDPRPTFSIWLLSGLIVAAFGLIAIAPRAVVERVVYSLAVIPARFGGPGGGGDFDRLSEPLLPLLGHVFVHGGILHLAMNLMVLLQVGGPPARRLEAGAFGAWRTFAVFFGSAAAGGLAYVGFNPGSATPAVGASGAVCGMFAGYLLAVRRDWRAAARDTRVQAAAFWFLVINVGLAAAARMTGLLPIAWEAHLGGFVGGAVLYPLFAPRHQTRA